MASVYLTVAKPGTAVEPAPEERHDHEVDLDEPELEALELALAPLSEGRLGDLVEELRRWR